MKTFSFFFGVIKSSLYFYLEPKLSERIHDMAKKRCEGDERRADIPFTTLGSETERIARDILDGLPQSQAEQSVCNLLIFCLYHLVATNK